MPKVSVIVPVYNTELYVERAIVSLMEQTLNDVQFIIIDDGSKDNSLAIIKQVVASYPGRQKQVILISRDNLGVAATRAQGMEFATGDYIIHLDSDDWAELNWLELMYHNAIENDADVVICDYNEIHKNYVSAKRQKVFATKNACVASLLKGNLCSSNWNKLVKREIFETSGIRFANDIKMGEDLLVTLGMFLNVEKVAYTKNALYNYNRMNENSLTILFDDKSLSDLIVIVQRINDMLELYGYANDMEIQIALAKYKLNIKNVHILNSVGRHTLKNKAVQLFPETNSLILNKSSPKFLKLTYFLYKHNMLYLYVLIDCIIAINAFLWKYNIKR